MIARYSRPQMTALWSDETKLKIWLDVEIAALEGMVQCGIAPQSALEAVKAKANFDVARVLEIEEKVKHDVIAFLTNVAEYVGEPARWLHFGMTSSDLLDTAFAIQLVQATDAILAGIDGLLGVVKERALEHKSTPCVGRSHGIHAEPTTFGLKLANWYAELRRQRDRVKQAREEIAVGMISGPVGTFAYVPPAVEAFVCKKFGLKPDAVSTQVISRDRHATLFSSFAQVGATLERMAVEVRHLQRTEVREASEYFSSGQKGSSAMPHKRNPVLSENITGLARLLRGWASSSLENIALWHERDISHSSVERVIAPDITITLDFMLARMTGLVQKMIVSSETMAKNLEFSGGLVFSGTILVELSRRGIPREQAYEIVQRHALATWDAIEKSAKAPTFQERLAADPEVQKLLSAAELNEMFSLKRHLAHVDEIFERVFR